MIVIYFFGRMADTAGCRRMELDPAAEAEDLFALRDRIFAEAFAAGQTTPEAIRMSVNQVVVRETARLRDGDEVAFFSMFSGG
ncbi:MAG: MoaD/ThiS family protein [Asticcacaulis sp.]